MESFYSTSYVVNSFKVCIIVGDGYVHKQCLKSTTRIPLIHISGNATQGYLSCSCYPTRDITWSPNTYNIRHKNVSNELINTILVYWDSCRSCVMFQERQPLTHIRSFYHEKKKLKANFWHSTITYSAGLIYACYIKSRIYGRQSTQCKKHPSCALYLRDATWIFL